MPEYTNPADVGETDGSELFAGEQGGEAKEVKQQTQDDKEADGEDISIDAEDAFDPAADDGKPAEPQEARIRIKYNGEEKEIPVSEAAALAQKGMNYDKVARERDELRNNPELLELDQWAQMTGVNRQEFIRQLALKREEALIRTAMGQIEGEYPGITEKAAIEIARTRTAQARQQLQANAARMEAAAGIQKLSPWHEFKQRYPNVRIATDLPQAVVDEMASGANPVEVMLRYERDEARRQLGQNRQNDLNRQRSLGSAVSKGADAVADAFSRGYSL